MRRRAMPRSCRSLTAMQIDVYLNTKALPRAQLMDRAVIVHSGEEASQAIHAAGVRCSEGSGHQEMARNFVRVQRIKRVRRALAFALRVSNEHVELIAQTEAPGYLVMSDVYYPGWTATIDDRPTTLYPANFAFRALLVPPRERHGDIHVRADDVARRDGNQHILTLMALIGFGVWRWRREGNKCVR